MKITGMDGWKCDLSREGEDTLVVTLQYPNVEDGPKARAVEIDMEDVRSCDAIRVRFDFDRNGWAITQESEGDGWCEVAFIDAIYEDV